MPTNKLLSETSDPASEAVSEDQDYWSRQFLNCILSATCWIRIVQDADEHDADRIEFGGQESGEPN